MLIGAAGADEDDLECGPAGQPPFPAQPQLLGKARWDARAGGPRRPQPDAVRFEWLEGVFGLSPLASEILLCLFAAETNPLMRLAGRARAIHGQAQGGLEVGSLAELLQLPVGLTPEPKC